MIKLGRVQLFNKVHELIREIGYYRTGTFLTIEANQKLERHWVNLFGFQDLTHMSTDELDNFTTLLQAKIRAERKLKCFPEFHNFIYVGAQGRGEKNYE